MTPEQAKEILNQALDQAFKKGVYSIADASMILQSLNILFNDKEETSK